MQNEIAVKQQQPVVISTAKAEKEVTSAQLMAKLTEIERKLIRIEEKLCKPLIN